MVAIVVFFIFGTNITFCDSSGKCFGHEYLAPFVKDFSSKFYLLGPNEFTRLKKKFLFSLYHRDFLDYLVPYI